MRGGFTHRKISRHSLCLHVPYAVCMQLDIGAYREDVRLFYQTLHITFVLDDAAGEAFRRYGMANTVVTGHPKLDAYLRPAKAGIWKMADKLKVVYAPHHSFAGSELQWATWDWNCDHTFASYAGERRQDGVDFQAASALQNCIGQSPAVQGQGGGSIIRRALWRRSMDFSP